MAFLRMLRLGPKNSNFILNYMSFNAKKLITISLIIVAGMLFVLCFINSNKFYEYWLLHKFKKDPINNMEYALRLGSLHSEKAMPLFFDYIARNPSEDISEVEGEIASPSEHKIVENYHYKEFTPVIYSFYLCGSRALSFINKKILESQYSSDIRINNILLELKRCLEAERSGKKINIKCSIDI